MGICNDGLSRRMSCWFSDSRRHWGSKTHLLTADGVRFVSSDEVRVISSDMVIVISSDEVRVISSDGISLRLLRGVSGSGVSGSGVSGKSEGLINLSECNIVGVIDGDGGSVVVVVCIRHTGGVVLVLLNLRHA